MPNAMTIETEDKDLLLRDDIRLLGRILGDTVREQSALLIIRAFGFFSHLANIAERTSTISATPAPTP